MCGIVASVGRSPVLPRLLAGLGRLEYRGYDSAGVALAGGADGLMVHRAPGRLAALERVVADLDAAGCTIGIGHTRWATHGIPSEANAHPHRDCSGTVAIVHNGTIENAAELRAQLLATGHAITTEVDTEVIAHLIEAALAIAPELTLQAVVAAVAATVQVLEGSWALAVVVDGIDGVVVARARSPLLIAETEDGLMASSDVLGFSGTVRTIRELGEGQIAALGIGQDPRWFAGDGSPAAVPEPLTLSVPQPRAERDDAHDETSQEMAEQPEIAQRLLDRWLPVLLAARPMEAVAGLRPPRRVRLVACGSSYYAAQVTARMLSTHCGIPANVVVASEHAGEPDEPGTLTIAFSQSGETADVLAARDAWAGQWLAVTNTPHSTLARGADAVLDLGCGPELGVAATKSFTAQVIAGALISGILGRGAGLSRLGCIQWARALDGLPGRLAATDAVAAPIAAELAAELKYSPGWVYASRGAGVPYAYEGALKLKELAYCWTEALPAGELKHGPIALLTAGVPAVVVAAEPAARLATNMHELRARGARVVAVGGTGACLPVVLPEGEPPWGPLESVIALQHLAREVTLQLGHDVDRPRNLAKSVTVE